jgi:hypothetical protein
VSNLESLTVAKCITLYYLKKQVIVDENRVTLSILSFIPGEGEL